MESKPGRLYIIEGDIEPSTFMVATGEVDHHENEEEATVKGMKSRIMDDFSLGSALMGIGAIKYLLDQGDVVVMHAPGDEIVWPETSSEEE